MASSEHSPHEQELIAAREALSKALDAEFFEKKDYRLTPEDYPEVRYTLTADDQELLDPSIHELLSSLYFNRELTVDFLGVERAMSQIEPELQDGGQIKPRVYSEPKQLLRVVFGVKPKKILHVLEAEGNIPTIFEPTTDSAEAIALVKIVTLLAHETPMKVQQYAYPISVMTQEVDDILGYVQVKTTYVKPAIVEKIAKAMPLLPNPHFSVNGRRVD